MSRKVLILSGSPRKNGNSDILCDEFMRGALESGHEVEKVRVIEKNIAYCKGCGVCQQTGRCVTDDDMTEVLQKMIDADVIVLASPIYFFTVSAPLKTLLERTFARGKEVRDKEFYYLLSYADGSPADADIAVSCFRGYAACVKGAEEKGILLGMGVYEKGEIRNTGKPEEAYEMGKQIG